MAKFKDTRHTVEPVMTVKEGSIGGEEYIHPAFGNIQASRVSGGHQVLHGSDFVHQHYIVLRISGATLQRSINRDWHFPKEQLVEVAMTESQWATFVSSLNVGSGVPCTLQYKYGERIPQIPAPANRTEQFSTELDQRLAAAIESLDEAISEAKTKTSEAKLKRIRQQLMDSVPWVAKQFSEHMEETTEKAKGEIHGYINAVVQRAGLEALGSSGPLLLTEDQNDG